MSNVDLRNITEVCHSQGSIKAVTLTALDNVSVDSGIPIIINSEKAYSIIFKKNTGGYNEQSNRSSAGTLIEQTLKFFLTGKRFDVDYIISQLLDNKCHVIYTDWNSNGEALLNAKLDYRYGTGTKKSDNNGYEFTFKSKTRKKYRNLTGLGIDLEAGDDPDTGTGNEETGGGQNGNNATPPFYVVINPTQLIDNPTPSGNTTNLNQFVTGLDGNNYFIDHLGAAMRFLQFPKTHIQIKSDEFTGNTITVADLPTNDDEFFINLNGIQVTLMVGVTIGKNEYSRTGDVIEFYRLTAQTIVDIYY